MYPVLRHVVQHCFIYRYTVPSLCCHLPALSVSTSTYSTRMYVNSIITRQCEKTKKREKTRDVQGTRSVREYQRAHHTRRVLPLTASRLTPPVLRCKSVCCKAYDASIQCCLSARGYVRNNQSHQHITSHRGQKQKTPSRFKTLNHFHPVTKLESRIRETVVRYTAKRQAEMICKTTSSINDVSRARSRLYHGDILSRKDTIIVPKYPGASAYEINHDYFVVTIDD